MVNYLIILENPQINFEKIFEVMRDFQMGGLNSANYNAVLQTAKKLPPIRKRNSSTYTVFDIYNLTDISSEKYSVIQKEVVKRGIRTSKICWHPDADLSTCNIDKNGEIVVTAAHSIQNNGILSEISENGKVASYTFSKGVLVSRELQKNAASTFMGFCNSHDSIFRPIENLTYYQSLEQNFLFAYRGFVMACHKKREASTSKNFGDQSQIDIIENKKIFDNAIKSGDYSAVESELFELPFFYPIAASSSFYLDFDFEGNSIPHSDDRMENIFVTLLPKQKLNKTYFILSYFKADRHLYQNLVQQLHSRNNLRYDITTLLVAHTDNIFFNPVYYQTFIQKIQYAVVKLIFQTQMDHGIIDSKNNIQHQFSYTPSNYLTNPDKINIFGY